MKEHRISIVLMRYKPVGESKYQWGWFVDETGKKHNIIASAICSRKQYATPEEAWTEAIVALRIIEGR